MEEEEREAQSAKLQELIRRGGPEDLREANRLMKIMAGYDTRHKTDYRAKAAEEVSKVQQKAKILEEMLQNFKPGDKIEGDVFEVRNASKLEGGFEFNQDMQELANALQSAHPKIQKMCEEESDDHEAVSKLLQINDSIHRTIERYKLVKAGDVAGAAQIPKGTLGTTTGVAKNAANELSLIDLDFEPSSNGNASASDGANVGQTSQQSAQGDLLGLSFQDEFQGPGGGIALSPSPGPGIYRPLYCLFTNSILILASRVRSAVRATPRSFFHRICAGYFHHSPDAITNTKFCIISETRCHSTGRPVCILGVLNIANVISFQAETELSCT